MTYTDQKAWRTIQQHLPVEYRIKPGMEPTEEWWDWQGHRIHLDTYRNPDAPVKVILFHGVGTNGRQMSTIAGAPLTRRGYETIAVDMPGYGVTEVAPGALVTYDDWVAAGVDLVAAELKRDDRPILLYGLSAGGMLTYHVAAISPHVAGIVGMTFLDQRNPQVQVETALRPTVGRLGGPVMGRVARTPLRRMRIPMWAVSKMHTLVNDKKALRACLADRTSAGNRVSMAFLASYMGYQPAVEPEDFATCPVLLTQPGADRWTPQHLSDPFLSQITRVPVTIVVLDNAGHYPLEQPGLNQMVDAIDEFAQTLVTP
ncbi:alpha/beta hydrolase [Mycolicibacterium aubagnense]|uniref:AB hydrolase-1 domain-containing protein n=1 Tax=Mycolicibacterium aubagnense TaxID=319707 RepID=A0ABM7IGM8_9MYCO|nr:alpha/beta fold hydrolase [Mycolicibacterium aubagnense]TLH68933.1 alpha/beta hydrolase [Mycolicibacterium aubagnense]WGI32465.1 alpha/beta fold hydrolase [Mycolicibacterium aubagnense]BBX85960.1 hypothetical protein MAUB_38330 [Mycolicibacterium aubagnense]